ncbi:hypothetical protein CASFOL_034559 [Castilleja foliolosa]|uniref:Uncharacterized protein n=1 Tax=Castilleja foliolosa TaxID=1961234 RepID=A0ABD3BQV6_9LAMI
MNPFSVVIPHNLSLGESRNPPTVTIPVVALLLKVARRRRLGLGWFRKRVILVVLVGPTELGLEQMQVIRMMLRLM